MNIEIIFDNGGSATLQDKDNYYIHSYDSMQQLAEDILSLKNGGDTTDWDGNEFDEYKETQKQASIECGDDPDEIEDDDIFLDPDYDDIQNGGYRVFDLDELIDYAEDVDLDNISWSNVFDVVEILKNIKEED